MCDWQLCFLVMSSSCAVYITNNSGPKTDPCGTPQVSMVDGERTPLNARETRGFEIRAQPFYGQIDETVYVFEPS